MKFEFPSNNLFRLESGIAKLNKKARKLGAPEITFAEIGRSFKKVASGDPDRPYKKVEMVEVEVSGEVPEIDGWKMVAALDHDMGVTIVNYFPGVDGELVKLPEEYRTRKPYCDHCHTHKVKKHSIIIENTETGELKQVGKTCLKDFFDKDIKAYLSYWGWFVGLIDELSDEDSEFYGHGGGDYRFEIELVLEVAFCAVRQWGYVKSSEMGATKEAVAEYFFTKDPKVRNAYEFTDADKANAVAAIEWVKNNEESSDFILNLKGVVEIGDILAKHFGYVAAIVPTYHRAMTEKREAAARVPTQYFGEVGKRQKLGEAKLVALITVESYYGYSYLHIFSNDETGYKFKWFSSRDIGLEEGATYNLVGFVKAHEEYKGEKQTAVVRVKAELVEEAEAEAA